MGINDMDDEIKEIAQENREGWVGLSLVAIVERGGKFEVHQHSVDGVAPVSKYKTARLAVSRVAQLLKTGPIAPQTHPEKVCIGKIGITPGIPEN